MLFLLQLMGTMYNLGILEAAVGVPPVQIPIFVYTPLIQQPDYILYNMNTLSRDE